MTQAQKEMLAEAMDATLDTRGDVASLESTMRSEFARLDAQLMVLKWMMGVMIAGTVSLILKAFFIG